MTLALVVILALAAALRFARLDYAPSGGHGDVAWIGINALDFVDRGIVPFYVRELYSPEFFPVLATGALLPLIGISYLPQRLFTAALGVLFVFLLYFMTYELCEPDDEAARQRAGLFAALAGALSLHVVVTQRLGMESPPFMTTVALLAWLTARAWRRDAQPGSAGRWALAGAALGLNQYIYLSARLLPIVMAAWMLHAALAGRARFARSVRGWLVMAGVSFVITLPAIALFVYAPEAFSGRADSGTATTGGWIWLYDTSAYGGTLRLMLTNIGLSLRGIGIEWVGPYNVMGLPILSPVFFAAFLAGSARVVTRPRSIQFAWPLLAIPLLWITDLISGAVADVNALHQMGAVPFVCALAGMGLAWLWARLPGTSAPYLRAALRGALLLGCALPTATGFAHYLGTVVPAEYANPELSWRKVQTDVDLGRYLAAHREEAFLLPYSEYVRQDVAWVLAAGYRTRRSAIDADGTLDVPQPPARLTLVRTEQPERARHDGYPAHPDPRLWVLLSGDTVHLLPPVTPAQADALAAAQGAPPSDVLVDASGARVADFYAIETPPGLFDRRSVVETPVDAVFDGRVRLLGYSADADLVPGVGQMVTLYWRPLEPLPVDYEVFAQFWTDDGRAVASAHDYPFSGMYRARIWRTDEVIATHHYLEPNADLAPGRYTLVAGLFRYLLNQSVPVAGADAAPDLRVLRVPRFRYAPPSLAANEFGTPLPVPQSFGGLLNVAGLDVTAGGRPLVEASVLRPGDSVDVRIVWEAQAVLPTDYSLFIHLTTGLDVPPLAQVDALIGGALPTSVWRMGERYATDAALTLPTDLPAGTYELRLGVYNWRTGERLLPSSADGDTSYRLPVTLRSR